MRCVSIRGIGIILVLVGVVLIGFFGLWNAELGSYWFPFAVEIGGFLTWFSWGSLEYSSAWWNAKLWGLSIGIVGVLMMRFG